MSLEGEIDGGVGDEKEDDWYDSCPHGSGPKDVVFYVVRVQSEGGYIEVHHLPGDVVVVRHVEVDQLQLQEPRDVQGDGDEEGGEDEDQGVVPAGES